MGFLQAQARLAALNSGLPRNYDGVEKLLGLRPNRTFSRDCKYSMAGRENHRETSRKLAKNTTTLLKYGLSKNKLIL